MKGDFNKKYLTIVILSIITVILISYIFVNYYTLYRLDALEKTLVEVCLQ